MSSSPCVLVCISLIFLGEIGACWEGYYSLFEEAVEPLPLENFNHLLDKLLAADIGRVYPALGLRAVLEASSASPWCCFPDFYWKHPHTD